MSTNAPRYPEFEEGKFRGNVKKVPNPPPPPPKKPPSGPTRPDIVLKRGEITSLQPTLTIDMVKDYLKDNLKLEFKLECQSDGNYLITELSLEGHVISYNYCYVGDW